VAWLKANPDKASAGTAGSGAISHVAGVFFQKETSTRFQFVPYRGLPLAIQDLMSGQIDLMFDQVPNALPHVRAGKLRAYAVTAKTRLDVAPEIPTVAEAGLPGLQMSLWTAFWVPKGTPKHIIAKLNAATVSALADPAVYSGSPTSDWRFFRAISRLRTHLPRCTRPKLRSGGPSSRQPTSRVSERVSALAVSAHSARVSRPPISGLK